MTRHNHRAGDVLQRFTLLRVDPNGCGVSQWIARCECGVEKAVRTSSLRAGHTVSCGCYAKENAPFRSRTHGHGNSGKTPTYQTWQHMRARCNNPSNDSYPNYGGKGVRVCRSWDQSFEAFLRDMGERPARKTLDRYPDRAGDYKPSNCRWATVLEQTQNTARCKLTPELAAEIRSLIGGRESSRALGRRLGVSGNRISAIWRGEAWRTQSEIVRSDATQS